MPWVTVIWSMIASACLTLAAIYWLAWYKNRTAWAHLLFSLTATSTAAFTFCELWMMRAETPGEVLAALRWAHVPLLFWLVSIVWFVRIYLRAGRPWLAWTVSGLRAFSLLINFLVEPNLNYREITSLRHIQFLGDSVTVFNGVPNPWMLVGQLAGVLFLVFVADASVTAWRRGDRRKALLVGGSIEFFLVAAFAGSLPVLWGNVQAPIVFGLPYMGLVAVMGYELSHDVFRASQLVRELQASNTQISDLFGRLIAAQETERTRIARDLHDDVSQRIAGLSIMISGIKRRIHLQPAESEVVANLTSLQQHTIALADEIRHLSHDLHPSHLQHTGLVAALSASCEQFEKLQAIAVTYSAGADIGQVDADSALCLFRITQEALRNVAKHADARHVGVALTRTVDGVQLSIADDGKGFDLAGMRGKGTGLGLVSIDERVRLLRGSVHIETQPHGGTRMHVQIPRPHEMPQTHAAPAAVTLS